MKERSNPLKTRSNSPKTPRNSTETPSDLDEYIPCRECGAAIGPFAPDEHPGNVRFCLECDMEHQVRQCVGEVRRLIAMSAKSGPISTGRRAQ